MSLDQELARIAAAAAAFASAGEEVAGVIAAEPAGGERLYVCAFRAPDDGTSWLVLDDAGAAVVERARVREAVSIAGLCEVAEEVAAGGDLDELLSRLVALRLTENPEGIDEAEAAVLALQGAVGAPPNVASPARLDAVGGATRRLEHALGNSSGSPFAEAMKQAIGTVEELRKDVEASYKTELA